MSDTVEGSSRYRILVVDDDPDTAEVVRSWYRGQPYDIVEARSGEEALRTVHGTEPDLILLDLKMPGLDGIAAARGLKTDPATRAIPVILLTACHETGRKVEAFAAGADDYVTKPFEFDEVDARIRAMLRRRRMFVELESTVENLKSVNQELEQLLVLDEKTGLYNFRHFQHKLREEWQRAERYGTPLSLVLLDLDNFKPLNDSLGHPAGDRALQEFATLVAGGARSTDVSARYGGEEFAIILPHTDGEMARRVAERIRLAVERFPFLQEEHEAVRMTVSAGVATYPADPELASADALVDAADRALYEAKHRGKNCVAVDASAKPGGGTVATRPRAEDRRRTVTGKSRPATAD